jgi:hypothetical protein
MSNATARAARRDCLRSADIPSDSTLCCGFEVNEVSDDELDGKPKKLSTARKVRMAIVFTLALLTGGALAYAKWVMKKSDLGGPCTYAFQCSKDAPKCMRGGEDSDGICSRPCDPPADCAPGIRCMKIELEERDEHEMPLTGGYCFSQTFIDAQRPHSSKKDASAPSPDSWIDVPNVPGQVEADVTFRSDVGTKQGTPKSFLVKGSLVRAAPPNGKTRTIVDTAAARAFSVDDDKKQFFATVLDPPQGDAKVDKTGKKDNILGRDCDVWRIDDGKATHEACILQGAAFIDPQARGVTAWQHELAVRGAFPLRVVDLDAKGQETGRMTATKFEMHPVDGSLFSIPKSYKNSR